MTANHRPDARRAIGRSPDRLTLAERFAFAGQYIALEIYTPETVPFRIIEAIGDSVEACIAQLRMRGLDPRKYEFDRLTQPY